MTRPTGAAEQGWRSVTVTPVGAAPLAWLEPAPPTRTNCQYPDPAGRPISVITAYNPWGRLTSNADNAGAQARLESGLRRRGLIWRPAARETPRARYSTPSVAQIGFASAHPYRLAPEFKQDAIFVFTPADRRIVSRTTIVS